MSTKLRNLLILAAVLLLSVVVFSAVAAQDSTAEPPAAGTTEPGATVEPGATTEPSAATEPSAPTTGRPLLGVSLQDSDNGVTVAEVLDGSAADDAGVQAGDIITAINGADVATVEDAKNAIAGMNVGDDVALAITRGDESMTLTATLGAQAPEAQPMQPRGGNNPAAPGRGNRGMGEGLGLTYDSQNQTWTITDLSEDSPLYTAGFRQGDVITQIDGEAVDPASLFQHLQSLDNDATVTVTVERDGASQDIQVSASDLAALGGFGGFRFGTGNLPRDFGQMMPFFNFAYGNGWLGVAFQTIDAQVAQDNNLTATEGALITEVTDGSPAADAGLQKDDIVTAVNGEAVDEEHTLRDRLIAYEAGDTVTLSVLRDGASQDIQVTLGEPQTPDFQNMFPNGFPFRGPNGGFPFGNQPEQQPTEEAAPNA